MKTKPKRKTSASRRAMFAKIHIALKDLDIPEDDYRHILMRDFGVETSKDLSDRELSSLVAYFESKGWQAGGQSAERGTRNAEGGTDKIKTYRTQAEALKERIGQEVLHSDFTEARLRGMVKKICGVDDLAWASDAERLINLLAAITDIMDREASPRAKEGK